MSKAQELFDEAFEGPRTPRSEAYRRGVLDALRWRLGEAEKRIPADCPFDLGTAKADAWFAGTDEGRSIFWRHKED